MRNLPKPPPQYDEKDQIELRRTLRDAERDNLKRNQDISLGAAKLWLTAPNGAQFCLQVADDGTLSTGA